MPVRTTAIVAFGRKGVSTQRYLQAFGLSASEVRQMALDTAARTTDPRRKAIASNVARRKSLGGSGG